MHLADRNKKVATQRSNSNKHSDNDTKPRYLEDLVITISDLLIYFFITRIIFKLDSVKCELASNYANISKWYMLMQSDDNIFDAFGLKLTEKIEFENIQQLQISFENVLKIDDVAEKSKYI